jgi:hypothetical protein
MKIATRIPLWDAPFQNAIMGRREAASCALRESVRLCDDAESCAFPGLENGASTPRTWITHLVHRLGLLDM